MTPTNTPREEALEALAEIESYFDFIDDKNLGKHVAKIRAALSQPAPIEGLDAVTMIDKAIAQIKHIEKYRRFVFQPSAYKSIIADLESARAYAQGRTQSAWQPIETAPRDGTRILAFWDFGISPCYGVVYYKEGDGWYEDDQEVGDPTHWHPLPAQPESEK